MSCSSSSHRWPVKDKTFYGVRRVSLRNTASIVSGGHLRPQILGFWTSRPNQPVCPPRPPLEGVRVLLRWISVGKNSQKPQSAETDRTGEAGRGEGATSTSDTSLFGFRCLQQTTTQRQSGACLKQTLGTLGSTYKEGPAFHFGTMYGKKLGSLGSPFTSQKPLSFHLTCLCGLNDNPSACHKSRAFASSASDFGHTQRQFTFSARNKARTPFLVRILTPSCTQLLQLGVTESFLGSSRSPC